MATLDRLADVKQLIAHGELDQAESLCGQVQLPDSHSGRIWHCQGIIEAQRGRLEEAAEYFMRAIAADPERAPFHFNLALARKQLGDLESAIASYRLAVACDQDFREARNNLGNTLADLGRAAEAIDCFLEFVRRFPDSGSGHYNLANLLLTDGDLAAALEHYRLAVELQPDLSAAWENLGRALLDAERFDEASEVWTRWLAAEPENSVATHMLASVSGRDTPDRCSDDYIRQTFDRTFADSFDAQLMRLDYRAPELVAGALDAIDWPSDSTKILDLGCGTGLCGPLVRPHAKRLVGVDLAKEMLDQARKRHLYDLLVAEELTDYLCRCDQRYDVILSADTLCYFGDLKPVSAAAARCLCDDGRFVFTLEAIADDREQRYWLQPNGRYAHAQSYVEAVLQSSGLQVQRIDRETLRRENGRQVEGFVITATPRL